MSAEKDDAFEAACHWKVNYKSPKNPRRSVFILMLIRIIYLKFFEILPLQFQARFALLQHPGEGQRGHVYLLAHFTFKTCYDTALVKRLGASELKLQFPHIRPIQRLQQRQRSLYRQPRTKKINIYHRRNWRLLNNAVNIVLRIERTWNVK